MTCPGSCRQLSVEPAHCGRAPRKPGRWASPEPGPGGKPRKGPSQSECETVHLGRGGSLGVLGKGDLGLGGLGVGSVGCHNVSPSLPFS